MRMEVFIGVHSQGVGALIDVDFSDCSHEYLVIICTIAKLLQLRKPQI